VKGFEWIIVDKERFGDLIFVASLAAFLFELTDLGRPPLLLLPP